MAGCCASSEPRSPRPGRALPTPLGPGTPPPAPRSPQRRSGVQTAHACWSLSGTTSPPCAPRSSWGRADKWGGHLPRPWPGCEEQDQSLWSPLQKSAKEEPGNTNWMLTCLLWETRYPGGGPWRRAGFSCSVWRSPAWRFAHVAVTGTIPCTENNTQPTNVSQRRISHQLCGWGQIHYFQWDLRFGISTSSPLKYCSHHFWGVFILI